MEPDVRTISDADARSNHAGCARRRREHGLVARRRWLVAGVLVAAFSTACGSGSDTSAANAAAAPGSLDIAAASDATPAAAGANEILETLNAARASARSCGTERFQAAPALAWNAALEQAAAAHAEWMQSTDAVGHTGANGSSVADRVAAAGYAWQSVGENVAAGQAELATVIAGWLDSPGHCSNIMNAAFVDAALAMKPGTSANRFRSYWTLVLARPR